MNSGGACRFTFVGDCLWNVLSHNYMCNKLVNIEQPNSMEEKKRLRSGDMITLRIFSLKLLQNCGL